jgi:hypothetical protein
VEGAFDYLQRFSDSIDRDVRFSVACSVGGQTTKGIHLRAAHLVKPTEFNVKVRMALNFLSSSVNAALCSSKGFNLIFSHLWLLILGRLRQETLTEGEGLVRLTSKLSK